MFAMDDENQNNNATIDPSKNKDSEVNQNENASDEKSVSEENMQSTDIPDNYQHDEKVKNDKQDQLMTENKVPGVDYCFKIHVVPSQATTVADDRLEECMKWFRSNSSELQKWENNTWKNVPAEEIVEKDLLQNVVDVKIFTPTDEKIANEEEVPSEEKIVKNLQQEALDEKEEDNYIQSWLEDFHPQNNQLTKVIDKTEEVQIIDNDNDTSLNDTCEQQDGTDSNVKKCSSLDAQLEDCMNWFRSYSFGKDAGNRLSVTEINNETPVEVDKENKGDKSEKIKEFPHNQPVGVTVEISFNRHTNVFDPFSNEDKDDVELTKIATVKDEKTLKDSLNEENNTTGILIKIEDVDETNDDNEDEEDEWPPSPDKSNTVCQNPFDDIVFLDYDSDRGEEWKNVSFLDTPTVEIEKNPFERYKGWFPSFNDELLETTSSEDEKGEGSGEIRLEDLSIEVPHIPENLPQNDMRKIFEPDSLAIEDSDENDSNSCFDEDVMVFDNFKDIRDSIEDIPAVVTELENENLLQDGFDDNMEPDSLIDNFGYHDSIENIDSSDDENTNEADIGEIEIFLHTEQEYEDENQAIVMETSHNIQSVEEEDDEIDEDEDEDSSLSESSCSSEEEEEEEEYLSSDSNNDIAQDVLNDAIDYDVIVVNGLSDSDDESDFNDDDTCDSMYTHGTDDEMEERNRFYHEPSTEENPMNSSSDNSALSESDESNNELLNELEELDELLEECMDYFRFICTEMIVQNLQIWNYDLDVFDSDVESIDFDNLGTVEEVNHQDSESDSQVSNSTRSDKETNVTEEKMDSKNGCNIASPTQLNATLEECIFADDEIFEECMMLFDKLINQVIIEREEDFGIDELCIEIEPNNQSFSPIRNSRKCWTDINDSTEKNAVESWLSELNLIQLENSCNNDVQLVNNMNTCSPIDLSTEENTESFEECMSWFRSIIDNVLDSAAVAPDASDISLHVQEFVTKLLEDGYEELAQQTVDEKAVDSDEDVPEIPVDEAVECPTVINDLPKIDLSFNEKLSEQLDGYIDSFDSDILVFDGKYFLSNSTAKKEESIEASENKTETRYPLIEHPKSVYESDSSEFVSDIDEDALSDGRRNNEDEIAELEVSDCALQKCMEYFCLITNKEKPHEDEIDFVIENSSHFNGSVEDALLEECMRWFKSVMNSNEKEETESDSVLSISCENKDAEVETQQTNTSDVNDLDIKDRTLDSKLAVCIDWLRVNSSEKEYNYERPDFKINTTGDIKDEVEVKEEKDTEAEKIPTIRNPGNASNDIIPDDFKGSEAPYGDIDDRLKKCITLLRSISYGLNDVGSDYINDDATSRGLLNKKDDHVELNDKQSETLSTDLKTDLNIDGEVEQIEVTSNRIVSPENDFPTKQDCKNTPYASIPSAKLDDLKEGAENLIEDEDMFLDCQEPLETTQDNDDSDKDLDVENVNEGEISPITSNDEEENVKPLEENEEETILNDPQVLPDSEIVPKLVEISVEDVNCESIEIGETMIDIEVDDEKEDTLADPNCKDYSMDDDIAGILPEKEENGKNEMELFAEITICESDQESATNQSDVKCEEEPTVNEAEITDDTENGKGEEKKIVVLIPPVVENSDSTQTSSSDSDEQDQAPYLDNTPEEVTSGSTDSSGSNEKENVSSEHFYGQNKNANQKEKPTVSFKPDVTRMSFEEARHYFALRCREVEGDFKGEALISPRSPRQTKPRNDFRYKNNKLQYSFNERMIEDLREACALIKQRFVHRPLKTIETLIDVLVRRNRVIRRSESSPHERTDSFDPSLENKEKNQSKRIKRRFSMKSLTELRSDKYRKEREMLSSQPSCSFSSKLYGPSVDEKVGPEPSFTRKVRFNGLMSNELTTQSQQMQSAFNAKLIQDLHEVYTLIENRSIKRSVKLVKEIISDIEKRNMTIRLIDRSSYEWDTESGDWIKLIKEIFGDDYCPNKN